MFCTICGAPQSEAGSPFCAVCGTALAWQCACRNLNSAEAKFCASCGTARPVLPNPKKAAAPESPLFFKSSADSEMNYSGQAESAAKIEQLSTAEIEQLLVESRRLSLDEKDVITQADIDKLFESN